MRTRALFLVLAAWAASSCGASRPRQHRPGASDAEYKVSIWVEADPRLPKELVFKGCSAWSAKRVTCVEAAVPAEARVRVYADDGECVVNDPDGGRPRVTLAWAYSGGVIRMMMKCLRHEGGIYDAHQISGVSTHEVGHQIGIWRHVPPECGKDAKKHPSGRLVCGQAVMNPSYNSDVDYVTEIDALAFDLREPRHSVLVKHAPSDEPDCVYGLPAH